MSGKPGSRQLPLDLPHRPHFSRADFLVAEANQAALAALDAFGPRSAGALAISGPPGSGKTHLAHIWASRTGARWIRPETLLDALPELASLPPTALAFDAADRIAGDAGLEQGLFHLLNLVRQQGGALLLTGRAPPARWPVALPDLRSRLAALQTVAVGAPDEALLGAVLVKLFADRQVGLGGEVISYLLARMDRSLAAARELVARLDAESLAGKRAITVPLAAGVLAALQDEKAEGE
ncbi:MAG: chromosomal replication initiator DnaA [Reyranellaceae bacterium]